MVSNLQTGLQPVFCCFREIFSSSSSLLLNEELLPPTLATPVCERTTYVPHLAPVWQPATPPDATAGQAFVTMDSILDLGRSGPLYLRQPEIARCTVDAIQFAQDQLEMYQLHAYVVMPNHVHLLITPEVDLAKITHSVKRFSAREANRLLGQTGQSFWQDESYDHVVRNPGEFERIAAYIENNPIRAGLVADPGDFEWSSARKPVANRFAG